MTKPPNEPTEALYQNGASLDGEPPSTPRSLQNGEMQLDAFRDLARRIHTDLSVQRFEDALHTLLIPPKRQQRELTVQPPTHSPES